MQQLRPSRPLWALLLAAGVLAAAAVVFFSTRAPAPAASRLAGRGGCARGFVREHETTMTAHQRALARKGAIDSDRGECVRLGHPEGGELLQVNQQRAARTTAPFSSVRAGAGRAAVRDANQLRANQADVPGSQGEWTPLGKGPMDASDPNYDQSQGSTSEGFHGVTGRVEDFAYDSAANRLFAAPVNGGVWQSDDRGGSWRSIGDSLPTQVVGSVAWTTANGGEVLALTGDPAFGFESTAGMGVYRSTDDGKTWQRGVGLPDGALGFQLAVDPNNANIIYAATSAGLYRTTDAGANWTNVLLPTGDCAGHTFDTPGCYLANIVTDVVVQGPANGATNGGKPGAVMAAVGWRAGTRPNLQTPSKPESPHNGIYTSDTGGPGTFQFVTAPNRNSGFAGDSQDVPGRIALGIANGPQQDHRVVYAVVQDAEKFNGNEGDDPLDQVPTGVFSQILNGIWMSTDFGQTWTRSESATALDNDQFSNSALEPSGKALSYEPGVQSWYNEWVAPDPTQQDSSGVPTRVAFGLEEIWATKPDPVQAAGPTPYHVIGRYWNACQFGLVNHVPRCDLDPSQSPTTSGSTTHPDQHAGLWIPDADGKGVTLFAGSDGGVFSQHVANGEDLANDKWSNNPDNKGPGAQGSGDLALHTLQPYDVEMAKDGTAYMGLQDNGEGKIFPDGTQKAVYGGDGFFTAVDPNNSNIAWEEYAGGIMAATEDGGKTWRDEDPGLTSAQFSTPFKMDPANAKHLLVSGRDVKETTAGTDAVVCIDPQCVTRSHDWTQVYDLGTMQHPGDANAGGPLGDPNDPDNSASAVELQGANAYVGYCGFCDVITEDAPFHNGLATNVGGSKPPKPESSDGWHIARATGLPNRFITSIAADPAHPEIVYVGLAGYGRHWAPPGARGENPENVGTGHVFRSIDAGQTFTDITGDLPDTPVNSLMLHGNQVVVGTDVGAFISSDARGSAWAPLGSGAPKLPYVHVSPKPGDSNTMVVATYGRGAYTYRFQRTANATPSTTSTSKPKAAATPVACAAAAGFRTASVSRRRHGVHFTVSRRAKPLASVDVFQVSNGRKVITERLVARFRNVRGSFNWSGRANRRGKRVRDGYLFARFSERFGNGRLDVRRVTLRRSKGHFTLRPSFYRRASCGLLSSYKLIRPVFGGRRNHALGIAYRVSKRARVAVTISRGGKVVRRFKTTTASARRTYRLKLSSKRQRRGDYRVKLTATAGKQKVTSTLVSRRL